MDVLNGVQIKEQLETDGKYNPDQLVDVMEYYDSQTITGKNESGLAYTVEELGTWSQKDGNRELEEIVVCKKTDNTYHYYYMNEFEALLENGSLKLEMDDESYRQLIKELEMGYYTSYSNGSFTLQDENGQTVYKTCWTFDGDRFGESYAPDGAANLLEVANEFPELNGHLSEMYGALRRAISDFEQKRTVYQAGFDNWTEGNTNFTYLFVDEDAKRVYTNNSHFQDYKEVEKNIQTLAESGKYVLVYPKLKDFQSNIDTSAGLWKENVESFHTLGDHYLAMAAVDTAYPIQDIFQSMAKNYNRQIPHIKWSGISLVLSIPLLLISIVWLTLIAGRSAGDEKGTLRLNLFDYWKTEAAAVLVIGIWILLTAFIINSWHGIGYTVDYTGNETSWYPNYHERLYYAFAGRCVCDSLLYNSDNGPFPDRIPEFGTQDQRRDTLEKQFASDALACFEKSGRFYKTILAKPRSDGKGHCPVCRIRAGPLAGNHFGRASFVLGIGACNRTCGSIRNYKKRYGERTAEKRN